MGHPSRSSYRHETERTEVFECRIAFVLIYPRARERGQMPKDLTIVLQDRPGELARLGEATGSTGVNIQGMCAMTGEGRGVIHLLFSDDQASRARHALE